MSRAATTKLDSLAAQRIAAGHTITTLARRANVNDGVVRTLENGGNAETHLCQRIADVLGVSLATLGQRQM
jgi:DNA-binding phage protein